MFSSDLDLDLGVKYSILDHTVPVCSSFSKLNNGILNTCTMFSIRDMKRGGGTHN